jgi:ABC-2 type transport system permease protein
MSQAIQKSSESLPQVMMRNLRTVGAISYYYGILPTIRVPSLLPFVFAMPFTILFILFVAGSSTGSSVASSDYFRVGLAGAITMSVAQQGLILGADLTNFKIEHKFQSMVVASPVSAFTYYMSVALSELVFAAAPIAVLLAIAHVVSGVGAFAILEILGVILLIWVTTSSIGFFLSTYVLNTRTAFLTVTFISTIISILPPVFYPITVLPSFLQPLAQLAPTTHASLLIQNLIRPPTAIPISNSQVTLSWIALPIFTAVFLAIALFKARWREK